MKNEVEKKALVVFPRICTKEWKVKVLLKGFRFHILFLTVSLDIHYFLL
jgi:hypothetical protein